MNGLLLWLTSPEWAHAVKALLHTLWQGAVLSLVLALVFRWAHTPTTRYRCAMAALAAVLLAGSMTWALIDQVPRPARTAVHEPAPAVTPGESTRETTQTTTIPAVAKVTASSVKWTAWLALFWIAGAALMLGRAGFQLAGAERLRRSTRPLDDPAVNTLLAEARAAMRLTRMIRALVTDKLTSPAVVGVIVPTLILPLTLVTTLTPEQLRFVLLHELAHIRRGDYLANLFQLFAEALLFFNPAVWWISHQVRREREACCDALATTLSGAPAAYARTLVTVAERFLPAPAAAAAFGERRAPSSLAERVQRLLVPGYRPSLRLTWRAMLLALFVGGALLFLSAAATRVTVAAILSPQERMERIEKKMVEYGVRPLPSREPQEPRERVLVQGRVRMADGSVLPKGMKVTLHSWVPGYSSWYDARVREDGVFTNTVAAGRIWADVHLDGYAPAVLGPADGTATNIIHMGELVVDRGFEISIRLSDAESSVPVTNATVKTAFILPESGHHLKRTHSLTPDQRGRMTLPLCVDQSLQVTVNAVGYEVSQKQFGRISAGQAIELKLRPGTLITGRVVDKGTAQGIGEATLRVIYEVGETEQHYTWSDTMRVLARTDGTGKFSITQLRRGIRYFLGVSAPGHESVILGPGALVSADNVITLGPELIVRGRVIGNVDALQKVKKNPVLYASFNEQFGNSSYGDGDWVHLRVADGAATFEFTNRVAGRVTLTGTGYRETRYVTAPIDGWVVDLNEPTNNSRKYLAENLPKREVLFRFTHSSGVSPKGTVKILVPEDLDPRHRTSRTQEFAITNGEVRVQIAIGGYTSIEPMRMPGFWFNSGGPSGLSHIQVADGAGPLVFDVPLVPSGAIYARARNADGTPAGGLLFGIHELERAPGRGEHGSLGNQGDSRSGDEPRKWVSGPLPLGGTYQVYGWRGTTFCVSKPIKLTEANPDAEVELQFTASRPLEGVVLDPNGKPVAGAELERNFLLHNGHGFGLKSTVTDARGYFRIEETTPDLGQYSVTVSAPGLRTERVKLTPDSQPQTIQLRRGEKLAGRVVEYETGHVLPDTEVRAVDLNEMKMPAQKTRTDAEGRFEFTSLGEVTYTLYINDGEPVGTRKFRAGVDTDVTVAVKLHTWSKVKPKPISERAGK